VTVIRDSIDVGASEEERYRHLRRIVENILDDVDGSASAERRRWIIWVLLYVMWHEGMGARTRTQTGGGPGRGLMQFEPGTLHWLIKEYVLGPTPGLVANLAAAAGVSPDEMREALRSFRDSADPPSNVWPNPAPNSPEKKLERWLLEVDSFGVKMMRYVFKALGQEHTFPPQNDVDRTADPQDERFKSEHSGHWARWWKRKFTSPEQEREYRGQFEEWARRLDEIARRAATTPPAPTPPAPPEQPAPPAPAPPAPAPPAPAPNPPAPTPPSTPPPSTPGQCPFVIVLEPAAVVVIRELRSVLQTSAAGRASIRLYESVRPSLVRWISTSTPALRVWRLAARGLAATSRPALGHRT